MYPIEYMTMTAPTPATISISVTDSGSTRTANGTLNVADPAHV